MPQPDPTLTELIRRYDERLANGDPYYVAIESFAAAYIGEENHISMPPRDYSYSISYGNPPCAACGGKGFHPKYQIPCEACQ